MNALKQGGPSVTVDCNDLLIVEGLSGMFPDIVFMMKFAGMGPSTSPHRKALGIVLFSHGDSTLPKSS